MRDEKGRFTGRERAEAGRKGEYYYSIGKPCVNGHLALRRTKNGRCVECSKLQCKNYYHKDVCAGRGRGRKWYYQNKEEYNKSPSRRFNSSKRRSSKLQRTPKWADLEAIKEFYKNCPEGMDVDHIIPLQGKLVSGFHIVENLQYLTHLDNMMKKNKYEPRCISKNGHSYTP